MKKSLEKELQILKRCSTYSALEIPSLRNASSPFLCRETMRQLKKKQVPSASCLVFLSAGPAEVRPSDAFNLTNWRGPVLFCRDKTWRKIWVNSIVHTQFCRNNLWPVIDADWLWYSAAVWFSRFCFHHTFFIFSILFLSLLLLFLLLLLHSLLLPPLLFLISSSVSSCFIPSSSSVIPSSSCKDPTTKLSRNVMSFCLIKPSNPTPEKIKGAVMLHHHRWLPSVMTQTEVMNLHFVLQTTLHWKIQDYHFLFKMFGICTSSSTTVPISKLLLVK